MRSADHPALAQPLSVWSPNRSNRHRNQTMSAAIQMKNQKDHRRTSPKSLVMASMARASSLIRVAATGVAQCGSERATSAHPYGVSPHDLRRSCCPGCWCTSRPGHPGRSGVVGAESALWNREDHGDNAIEIGYVDRVLRAL